MRILLASLLGAIAVLSAPASAGGETIRKIVVFTPATTPQGRLRACEGSGAVVVRSLDIIDAVVIEASASEIRSAQIALERRADVLRVDPDPRQRWIDVAADGFREDLLPDLRARVRGMHPLAAASGPEVTWGVGRVNAPAAWPKTRGEGIKVCVIDTGIDYNHLDLKPNIIGGWNALNKDKPDDFMDDLGHGTHVAGTIAAVGKERGIYGVAPKASLYGVKVMDANGEGAIDDIIAGIQWCADKKAQVANMSLGGIEDIASLKAAVEAATKSGMVIVAAAGNYDENSNPGKVVKYPAAYPQVIAVAASDKNDKVASFSAVGPAVGFIAPGVNIKSTFLSGSYRRAEGTSMASPHVTGLVALLIAAKKTAGSGAVRAALRAAATKLAGTSEEEQGDGMIDAAKLVGAP